MPNPTYSFSALNRRVQLDALQSGQWDLVIIGGGITGAGILLDAVSRGMKAALVEKKDFAWGTSSRSTKLIHGGLRYLKQFEIGLVREVGLERAIVYQNARHIVRPEPMLLPIYKDGGIGMISGTVGLWLYDMLADVGKSEKRKMLTLDETLKIEPLLRKEDLKGGGLYYEYRTDDARLTLDILKTAVRLGGLAINYCKVDELMLDDQVVRGVRCRDMLSSKQVQISAKKVINATGPWVDSVRQMDERDRADQKLLLTKGVHLVVPKARLPIQQSVYFDIPHDNRMVFCIPREETVYMGTTDTLHQSNPDDLFVTLEDKEYLLNAVNATFPGALLKPVDVISAWAGLRPLIYERDKTPSELSRKDEIFIDPSGLVSIAGGKLTGYRKMAERVVDAVSRSKKRASTTRDLPLVGCTFNDENERRQLLQTLVQDYSTFETSAIRTLFERYGAQAQVILEDASASATLVPEEALVRSEVRYAVDHEMTHSFEDFITQRTSAIHFHRNWLDANATRIVQYFAEKLDWNPEHQAQAMESYETLVSA